MSQTLAAALTYAARGILVFPCWHITAGGRCGCGDPACPSPGKHPLTVHGVKDATVDPATIRQWFGHPPEPNIAGATGADFIALDEDVAGSILALGIDLPNGPVARTGRPGLHYIFKANGHAIPSRAKFAPGLDIRGSGGHIVMAPSRHASGRQYAWTPGHSLEDVPIPDLPDELVRLIMAAPGSNGAAPGERDLFGRLKVEALIEQLETMAADGPWRETMLKLIGSLIGRQLPDDLIRTIARRGTRKDLGFDHQETDELVTGLIRSTRKRWNVPEPDDEATFDQVDGEPTPVAPLRVVSGPELLTLELPPRNNILGPWLVEKSLAMLFGPRGEGKTFLVLGIAIAITTGGKFLGWEAPKARRLLVVDGEMPAVVLKERVTALAGGASLENLSLIAADLQETTTPNLATVEGQQAIAEYVDQTDVIILDNLASLCRTGDENEREAWLVVQGWLLKLRSQGKAVILVHHAGKSKDQRGTSAREDVLDTVVKLSRPTDCQGDEGLRVEWHFVKHRGFYGSDAMPIEVSLTVNQGELTWTWQPLETSLVIQVAEHLNQTECSLSDIAKDMGLPKTTVWRLKKRAEAMGLLKSKPGAQKRND